MSTHAQTDNAMPAKEAARKARVARALRRITALPFWALLAVFVASWPLGEFFPSTAINVCRFVAPLLLIPVALIRSMPTLRVVGLGHYAKRRRRSSAYFVGACFVFAAALLAGGANFLAPAVVPTVPVKAKVTECHREGEGRRSSGHTSCTGEWTVNGKHESGRSMPYSAPAGSTVPIAANRADNDVVYGPPSGGQSAMGALIGAMGIAFAGYGVYELFVARRRIGHRLDEVIAGRATVAARIFTPRAGG
ncbi:hypothetical protein [Streptomyces sp. ODS28]|uniref:hypothetical protein n=1 Tax=Streptomyces sp. ODS28 TaxID=3136688 RepID=UPI0031F18B9F